MHNQHIVGVALLMSKFDKVSARLSSSQKYRSTVAERAIKLLIFKYHEAISIFLGSKNVLNLGYFWVFQKYAVPDPLSHTNRSYLWGFEHCVL